MGNALPFIVLHTGHPAVFETREGWVFTGGRSWLCSFQLFRPHMQFCWHSCSVLRTHQAAALWQPQQCLCLSKLWSHSSCQSSLQEHWSCDQTEQSMMYLMCSHCGSVPAQGNLNKNSEIATQLVWWSCCLLLPGLHHQTLNIFFLAVNSLPQQDWEVEKEQPHRDPSYRIRLKLLGVMQDVWIFCLLDKTPGPSTAPYPQSQLTLFSPKCLF